MNNSQIKLVSLHICRAQPVWKMHFFTVFNLLYYFAPHSHSLLSHSIQTGTSQSSIGLSFSPSTKIMDQF